MLASQDVVVTAIFELLEARHINLLDPARSGFWQDLLRVAASNGSPTAVRSILDRQNLVEDISLPLEDACRGGHAPLVDLLVSYRPRYGLTSRRGALYWAARSARYDTLGLEPHGFGQVASPCCSSTHRLCGTRLRY